MKILALDSSAKSASVAIAEDNKIIGSFFINTTLTHSQTLVPMIDSLLENTKTSIKDIDAFAISAGPGSFTGVRIGVSAIKGMAMATNKKCIPISTLESMAYNFLHQNATIVAVMDARCNQVYNANFTISNGEITRLCEDRPISIEDLTQEVSTIDGDVILVGDGAVLCYEYMKNLKNVILSPENLRYQNAFGVVCCAFSKNQNQVTAQELLPVYLRLPQAQRELKKRMENLK